LATEVFQATGRRKEATAVVRIVSGKGERRVNGKPLKVYLSRGPLALLVEQPIEAVGMTNKLDVLARAKGGGISGQAEAIRLGIARALAKMDESLRPVLKKGGFLTRDPRVVERKKYGRVKARKRFQFSKR
jgi:small subunit ribosomal protein S9